MQQVTRSRRNISNLFITASVAAVGYLLWDKNHYLDYTRGLEATNKDLMQQLNLISSKCNLTHIKEEQHLEEKIHNLHQQLASIITDCEVCSKKIYLSKEHTIEKQALQIKITELEQKLASVADDYGAKINTIGSNLLSYDKQFNNMIESAYATVAAIKQQLDNFENSLQNIDPLSNYMKGLQIEYNPDLTPAFKMHATTTANTKLSTNDVNQEVDQPQEVEAPKLTV